MPLRSEAIALKVCGNCRYASGNVSSDDLINLEIAYLDCLSKMANLGVLRKRANGLKDESVLCGKGNAKMNVFNEACVFWRKK